MRIYLAALGLNCSTQDLSLQRAAVSLVVTQALQLWLAGLVVPRHVAPQFPDQGLNLRPWPWEVDSSLLDHQGSPHRPLCMC